MEKTRYANTSLDVIGLATRSASGERPVFTGDPRIDKLLGISLALATELAVTRERLDTVERMLERVQLMDREQIDAFRPSESDADERSAILEDLLSRVFRVLVQDDSAQQNLNVDQGVYQQQSEVRGDGTKVA